MNPLETGKQENWTLGEAGTENLNNYKLWHTKQEVEELLSETKCLSKL